MEDINSEQDGCTDIIDDLLTTTENIIKDLEKENTKLITQLDTIYTKLVECIDILTNIEDNLYIAFEQLEEQIKDINTDWLDIELKMRCHDVLYKPMTQMVNTLKHIVDEHPLTPNNVF